MAGAAGLVMPSLTLRAGRRARRAGLLARADRLLPGDRHVAGRGRGVEQALTTAAAAGEGWAFTELRAALNAGYVRGETPWQSLDRLGADLGTPT